MEARRNELKDALQPGDQESIKQAIRALKGGFPTFGIDEASAEFQTEFYLKALASFPLWAVHEACARFRDGRNATPWNARECPTSAQMAAECRAIISPVQDELIPLADVLDAEIHPEPDHDMQKRLSDVMKWEKDIRPAMAGQGETKTKETPDEALTRLKSEGWGNLTIGHGAAAIIDDIKQKGTKKGAAA